MPPDSLDFSGLLNSDEENTAQQFKDAILKPSDNEFAPVLNDTTIAGKLKPKEKPSLQTAVDALETQRQRDTMLNYLDGRLRKIREVFALSGAPQTPGAPSAPPSGLQPPYTPNPYTPTNAPPAAPPPVVEFPGVARAIENMSESSFMHGFAGMLRPIVGSLCGVVESDSINVASQKMLYATVSMLSFFGIIDPQTPLIGSSIGALSTYASEELKKLNKTSDVKEKIRKAFDLKNVTVEIGPQPIAERSGANTVITMPADGLDATGKLKEEGDTLKRAMALMPDIPSITVASAGNYSLVHNARGTDVIVESGMKDADITALSKMGIKTKALEKVVNIQFAGDADKHTATFDAGKKKLTLAKQGKTSLNAVADALEKFTFPVPDKNVTWEFDGTDWNEKTI